MSDSYDPSPAQHGKRSLQKTRQLLEQDEVKRKISRSVNH